MTRSRSLPHQREAEAAVLGAVLLKNEVMTEVAGMLEPDTFYVPAHRAIFSAFGRLFERGAPIDIITVEAELRAVSELGLVGGIEFIGQLADRYATTHHVATHAELVLRSKRLRDLAVTAQEIAEEARGDVEDIPKFVDAAERRILEVNEAQRHDRYVRAGDLMHVTFEAITKRAQAKSAITGVATGYADLDEMTGGLQGGDLIIVAGRPSMGKTAFALNIAQHAALIQERHMTLADADRPPLAPALVISIEMSKGQLIERMLCSEARVDASRLRAGRVVEHEFRKLVNAAARIHKSPLYITDPGSPTITQIRAEARRFRADRTLFPADNKDPKGVIVVDYLQLACGGRDRYDSREQEVSEISRGLKGIAKETGLPVVALSQLNRGVDARADKRPNLSDLRESGAIEQDADVIMFVYREEHYAKSDEDKEKCRGDAEIIVGKQRNGPTGTVHLVFRGEYTRFENRTPNHYG